MLLEDNDYDLLVVGCGFCGTTIARLEAEKGKKVLILEKRSHIAGNMYDEIDKNGILVHKYGPHTIHTSNRKVYDFLLKYGNWFDYKLQCGADLDGIVSPTPFNWKTIDLLYSSKYAVELKQCLQNEYFGRETVTIVELLKNKKSIIKNYAKKLFDLDYRPYTVKQWGLESDNIDISILKRVPVRLSYKEAYFDDKYQIMPTEGYTVFFKKLLDHPNITVELKTNALDFLKIDENSKKIFFKNKQLSIPVVYTGPIDSLFDYKYGRLPYRSLDFKYETFAKDIFQMYPVIAYPKAKGYTRIVEYKKLPMQNAPKITTVVYEYPLPADEKHEPYYPILTDENVQIYEKYKKDVENIKLLYLCGRLSDYKYYNMDVAIEQAFEICSKLEKRHVKNKFKKTDN